MSALSPTHISALRFMVTGTSSDVEAEDAAIYACVVAVERRLLQERRGEGLVTLALTETGTVALYVLMPRL